MNTSINSIGVNEGYAGYGSSQVTRSSSSTAAAQTQQAGSTADEVTLSSNEAIGKHLSALLGFPTLEELSKMSSIGTPTSNVIQIEDIRKAYEESFADLKEKLGDLLEEAGVDRSTVAELRVDSTGKIVVTNDHPDKETIEQIFEDNPELANQFRGLSGLFSLLEAADSQSDFAAAYERNPYAAIAEFSELFSDQQSVFELLIGSTEIEATSAVE